MNYLIFTVGLCILVPIGTILATYSRRYRDIAFGLLVFSTAFTDWLDINFMERWWYAGSTRAYEVSVTDLLTLIVLFSTLFTMRREGARLFWPSCLGTMILFLCYGCASVAISDPKIFGLFELTKIIRGIAIFLAVVWHVRSDRDALVLLYGTGGALIFNGVYSLFLRYSATELRVTGTFPHQNILGDYCVMLGPVVLAVSLYTFRPSIRVICGIAWVSAAVATVLTISRMPAAAFMAGSAAVLVTTIGFNLDLKKVVGIFLLGLLMLSLFFRGSDHLFDRQSAVSNRNQEVGMSLRTAHMVIGATMAQDHLFGVGLNNWGWYYAEYATELGHGLDNLLPYEGTVDPGEGRSTQGHTLYGMTLGEQGILGLLILLFFILQCLYLSGYFLIDKHPNLMSKVSMGCFFGILMLFIASGTEITFRNQQIYLIFNILLGFVVATRHYKKAEKRHEMAV